MCSLTQTGKGDDSRVPITEWILVSVFHFPVATFRDLLDC
jgi:hypothetical protein